MSSPRPVAPISGAPQTQRRTDAARALDAAVHRGLDQRAQIFVFHRALFSASGWCRRRTHRLILQVALAALIADRQSSDD